MKWGALLATIALAGCQTRPQEIERPPTITEANFCVEAGKFLNNPWASDWQKLAVYERMRNKGCMN